MALLTEESIPGVSKGPHCFETQGTDYSLTQSNIPGDKDLNPTAVQRSKLAQLVILCDIM